MAKKQDNVVAGNDVYTALLGLAVLSVIATSVFVAMRCMSEYGTILSIVK